MKQLLFFLLSLSAVHWCTSQTITFQPMFGDEVLELERTYVLNDDSIRISKLRWYISDLVWMKNGKVLPQQKSEPVLLDMENKLQLILPLDPTLKPDTLRLDIGLDSLTHVSGALAGDLDPMQGMYWAWQSGYVHIKIEGYSTKCTARNHQFQFHLGGYGNQSKYLQTMLLPVQDPTHLFVEIDLKKFLSYVDLTKTTAVMSPGPKAAELSVIYKNCFVARP